MMTPLDRLRAAFPEKDGWHDGVYTEGRPYSFAEARGFNAVFSASADSESAAVDACIAARDAFLRPWIERAISECAMRMRSKCGDHCQHCDEAAPGWSREEITNAVLRGEE